MSWFKKAQSEVRYEFEMPVETENSNEELLKEETAFITAIGEVYPADPSVGYNKPHVGYWNISAVTEHGPVQLSLYDKHKAEEIANNKFFDQL